MSEQVEYKKVGLFDFVKSLGETKEQLLTEETNSQYNQFMINRAFMQHIDTVLLANEMNKSSVSNDMHHDFLYYSIDKKRRYGKWAKATDEDLELIEFLQTKYCINKDVAEEYLKLSDRDELIELKKQSEQYGGINK